tara:strand:+ start:3868 stop:4794 length:927 start_codon:yes stop_codon:yes gene_type:complete
LRAFVNLFPLWVILFSSIALLRPVLFTWFSGNLISFGLGIIMLGMGLTLKVNDFKILYKNPKWITTGVLIQFSVMPFLGWIISKIFELPDFFAVGLILVSCCPGGTASNVIAYLSNLNVAFSVSMTFISTVAGVILTPLLITNLSGELIDVDIIDLLLSTTKVVLVPVFLGVVVSKYFPLFTKRVIIYSPSVSVLFIVLIVASIIGEGKEIIFQSGINLIIAVMTLHLLGFILGYIISFIFLRDKKLSKAICIEIGMQNSGLGVVLAKENYVNPTTAIPSAMSSLVHSIYGSIFVSIFKEDKLDNDIK